MIHNASDYMRLFNAVLAALTVVFMLQVTYRLAPSMHWYELLSRQGITFTFFAFMYGSVESLVSSAPYGLRIFLTTFGLTTSLIGFYVWARHLPKREKEK